MSDKELQILIQKNPNKGFSTLMNLYKEEIYWYVRKKVLIHEDADDILQNTFAKVWKNISKFRGESSYKTWIYAIAKNETYTYLKKSKKHAKSDIDNISNILKAEKSRGFYNGEEIETILYECISRLPPKQEEVFRLKYIQDLTYIEIQEILGGSIGSLKASYHHATTKIKNYIKSY